MIHPHVAHRFVGDSGTDTCSTEIDVRFPDGERRRVTLRLGQPYHSDLLSGIAIRAELENLDSTDGPLPGLDTMQAILFGLKWIVARLAIFEHSGCKYFWPDQEAEFDFRDYFDLKKWADRSSPDGVGNPV